MEAAGFLQSFGTSLPTYTMAHLRRPYLQNTAASRTVIQATGSNFGLGTGDEEQSSYSFSHSLQTNTKTVA